ncbi:hypothetical protein YC2023_079600 [Brassica napus]
MSTLPNLCVVVINALSGFGVEGTEHPDQLMTVGRSLLFRIPPCPPSLSERSWCKDLISKNPKLFLLAFQQPLPSQPDTILAQMISYVLSLHPGRPQLHIRHHRQLASRPILRPDKGASSRPCATRGSSDFGGPVQPYKIKDRVPTEIMWRRDNR